MKLGSKDISKVYLGSKEISKVYLGSKEIFSSEIAPNGSPSELVATVLSDTSIKLDWTIGSTNQDGHRIYYKQDGGSYSVLATVTGSTATYTATDLTAATEYYFYVVAYKGSKESSASNVVNGITYAPYFSNALFLLNGDIIDVSGTKYFQDKTSNVRNFLITGYDFDSLWTKGFPYKSAATISAPAGDATLIAADLNSILYTSGTPNQIPVTSLFQNMDYANRMFCRHEAQVVDGNGVETYEPRVKDIVLYANAKTGADLTKCNTYYGVPTIDAAAKWVDPVNGNDSTGNGTLGTPWKKISKAEATVADDSNITVYVKTGTINETNWFAHTKNTNYIAIGLTKLTSTGTYTYLPSTAKVKYFTGFIIDGTTTATTAVVKLYTNLNNLTIDKCRLTNGTFKIIDDSASVGTNVKIKNSHSLTTLSNLANHATAIEFDTCYFEGKTAINTTTGLTKLNLFNNKIKGTTTQVIVNPGGACTVLVYGGYYKATGGNRLMQLVTGSGTFKMKSVTVEHSLLAVAGVQATSGTNYDVEITDITTSNNSAISSFVISSANKLNFFRNNSDLINASSVSSASIRSDIALAECNVIGCNSIKRNSLAGYGYSIGTESSSAGNNIISNIILSKTKTYGMKYFTPSAEPTSHGLFVGYQKDAIISHFRSVGHGVGVVVKGNATTDFATGGVFYGIMDKNNSYGIYVKGAKNVPCYGNTIIMNQPNTQYGILYGVNAAGEYATGGKVKNSIIINSQTGNAGNYSIYVEANSHTGFKSDYNIFYNAKTDGKIIYFNGVEYTFADWQALGFDTHSIMLPTLAAAKALFTDYDNGDYSLVAGSAAIGSGVDLGAAYDDGLDASTVWGSDSQLPTVVTKQQGASWDIGAYVH